MSDVLEQIVARTRQRLAAEPMEVEDLRLAARQRAATREPHAFAAALRRDGVNVIAEIKAASPSAGPIVDAPDVEAIAREYARGGAAAVSIVTEPDFFRGSRGWLAQARDAAGLPVIMKDFIVEPSQLMQGVGAGADAILLLASLLDGPTIRQFISLLDGFGVDALVEVHDEAELQRAIAGGARLVGVNNRDLRDFRVDLGTAERLAKQIPVDAIKVAESGIKTRADVDRLRAAGFHAFLVGESLLRQNDRAAAVRALVSENS
ncbi:MAG TPA: indole-3-glycerol phosphate synthase TrpC [Thermoanaerobaculia bacterium]|jgi:indole-3-glycerol phosphate synthase|nr:indole-3-glycerol phosphate synthase TrpC [Thermoanaerobaculia bacterium]